MGIISVLFLVIGHYSEEKKMVIASMALAIVFLLIYLIKAERQTALIWIQLITAFTGSLELLRLSAK